LAGNTPVAVGGTVNSNPDSWVQNGVRKNNDKTWNDPSMELSRQVLKVNVVDQLSILLGYLALIDFQIC
jgi:hypothetical protein